MVVALVVFLPSCRRYGAVESYRSVSGDHIHCAASAMPTENDHEGSCTQSGESVMMGG